MKTVIGAALVIGLAYLLSYFAGFSVIQLAADLGIQIDAVAAIEFFLIGTSVAVVLMLAISFLGTGTQRVIVNEERIKADSRDVPFDNIARVNYDSSQISDMVMKTGSVHFELTGTSSDKLTVEFVDHPLATTEKIQLFLNNYRMKKYQRFADSQRIERAIANF